ncbi:uncharacterized protein LOC121854359 [Homarus americanus]|uniref:uncharacterized protein LOC121854359 n=1 Tax=Homarus americanus TaxID=6706 RepID=UPI001C475AE8|nr:uncharacterized protein LOC121854359 [Homarus americanus]
MVLSSLSTITMFTTTRRMVITTLLLLGVIGHLPVFCAEDLTNSTGDYNEEGEDEDECSPKVADRCFNDVQENLLCYVDTPVNRNCTYRDPRDFCEGMEDALNCTADIIDTGCSVKEGRDTFDIWLKGLRAVHRNFCDTDDLTIITDLLESSNCWKFKKFIRCVEDEVNVTHVSDLLTTKLDRFECNWIQLSVGACNANAEKNNMRCRGRAEAVQEAIAVFFAATSCGHELCANFSPLQDDQQKVTGGNGSQQTGGNSNTSGGSSVGSAVVSTLVVIVVVMSLVMLILVKHRVLTFKRLPRLCPSSSSNIIGSSSTSSCNDQNDEYDRFE